MKDLPQDIYNDKGKNNNFEVSKPSKHHLSEAIKVNTATLRHLTSRVCGHVGCWEGLPAPVVPSPGMHSLNPIMRKHQANPKRATSCDNDQISSVS